MSIRKAPALRPATRRFAHRRRNGEIKDSAPRSGRFRQLQSRISRRHGRASRVSGSEPSRVNRGALQAPQTPYPGKTGRFTLSLHPPAATKHAANRAGRATPRPGQRSGGGQHGFSSRRPRWHSRYLPASAATCCGGSSERRGISDRFVCELVLATAGLPARVGRPSPGAGKRKSCRSPGQPQEVGARGLIPAGPRKRLNRRSVPASGQAQPARSRRPTKANGFKGEAKGWIRLGYGIGEAPQIFPPHPRGGPTEGRA